MGGVGDCGRQRVEVAQAFIQAGKGFRIECAGPFQLGGHLVVLLLRQHAGAAPTIEVLLGSARGVPPLLSGETGCVVVGFENEVAAGGFQGAANPDT
ncbi:hypothetical protein GCM10027167_70900 [Nocardia heshunensis]